MTLTDTHAHIYLEDFNEDLDIVVSEATKSHVMEIYMPNIDSSSIIAMHAVEQKYPNCFSMMGLHPCSVKEKYRDELQQMKSWLDKRPYAAIGEIGIDLYWDKTFVKEQEDAFKTQIEWALEYQLPIVIHSRDSLDMTIGIVESYQQEGLTGIFHCFTGTTEQAHRIIQMGFFLGIGGVLTYKNSGLDVVMRQLPLDQVVLETDSPYLSPVPFRGKRNQPAYLNEISEKLAVLHGITIEDVAKITSANAKKIFKPYTLSEA